MDGLFDSFARLDSRISSVGQTAAKIGDHLQVKFLRFFKWIVMLPLIQILVMSSNPGLTFLRLRNVTKPGLAMRLLFS